MRRDPSQTAPSPATLYWLCLTVALVVAPHLQALPLWLSILLGLSLGWRLLAIAKHWQLPGLPILLILMGLAIGGVWLEQQSLTGRTAGSAVLATLAVLKLLETRKVRDVEIAVFISYFLIITHFFFSQTIATAAYLFLLVLVATTLLLSAHHPAKPKITLAKGRLALSLFLQGLPIMLVLFVFFPRASAPLWNWPQDKQIAVTGLGDNMRPGSISKLLQSEAVAFRARFDSPAPPSPELYWRGLVLWHYNGKTWNRRPPPFRSPQVFDTIGEPTRYNITLEPHGKRYLFTLDLPVEWQAPAELTPEYRLVAHKPVKDVLRYSVSSALKNDQFGSFLPRRHRDAALQLPQGYGEKARQLAAQWVQQTNNDPAAIIRLARQRFASLDYHYTLSPKLTPSDPVDQFLFETKEGFCEHYAGAFTFLMRAAGIPSRVVLGYQGATYNKVGDYYMVLQANAHAWSEVWLDGQGWQRVDPTAYVAPERVNSSVAQAIGNQANLSPLTNNPDNWITQAYQAWDAINDGWNQWVLGYGPEKQYELFDKLGLSVRNSAQQIVIGLGLIAVLLALIAAWQMLKRERAKDPLQREYQRYLTKLDKHGVSHRPHDTARQLLKRIQYDHPQIAERCEKITQVIEAALYRPDGNPSGNPSSKQERKAKQKRLRRLIKRL